MGLADVIRSGVAVINSVTSDLQVTVQHYAWTGNNDDGESTYDTVVNLSAIVQYGKSITLVKEGRELIIKGTSVTVVGPITDNGASNRQEPVDPRDRLVLPDGTSGTIVDIKGVADPSTSAQYIYEVFLG